MAKPNPFLKKATGAPKAPASVDPKKKHGLGRGLSSLIPSTPIAPAPAPVPAVAPIAAPKVPVAQPTAEGPLLELPILDLERSPYQPRREFKEEELRELAESLKNNGLIQPPTVRKNAAGKYEIIAGERRVRAAQFAGWKKIQVLVKDVDEETAAVMTTTENIQREDLNPIEEANSYKILIDRFDLTQAEVAERVGRGRASIANATRLLELPDEVKALVANKLLSVGHAKVLLSLDSEKERTLLARDCVNDQLTVRALEKKIQRLHEPVEERPRGKSDLPEAYVRNLTEKMKRHLGCAVRITPGMVHPNGRHTKGVLEVDFLSNDDLDRIIQMLGVNIE